MTERKQGRLVLEGFLGEFCGGREVQGHDEAGSLLWTAYTNTDKVLSPAYTREQITFRAGDKVTLVGPHATIWTRDAAGVWCTPFGGPSSLTDTMFQLVLDGSPDKYTYTPAPVLVFHDGDVTSGGLGTIPRIRRGGQWWLGGNLSTATDDTIRSLITSGSHWLVDINARRETS